MHHCDIHDTFDKDCDACEEQLLRHMSHDHQHERFIGRCLTCWRASSDFLYKSFKTCTASQKAVLILQIIFLALFWVPLAISDVLILAVTGRVRRTS
jgi:hypothetical protein